jgi:hypothetical protein
MADDQQNIRRVNNLLQDDAALNTLFRYFSVKGTNRFATIPAQFLQLYNDMNDPENEDPEIEAEILLSSLEDGIRDYGGVDGFIDHMERDSERSIGILNQDKKRGEGLLRVRRYQGIRYGGVIRRGNRMVFI